MPDLREHFIPFRSADLVTLLLTKPPAGHALATDDHAAFRAFAEILAATIHHEFHQQVLSLRALYAPVDPNADTLPIAELSEHQRAAGRDEFLDRLRKLLTRANYTAISSADLHAALARESVFAVRLHTELDDFSELVLYRRGLRRRQEVVSSWFGWRRRLIEVDYFERVALYVRFQDEAHFQQRRRKAPEKPGTVTLKLFQNIPRDDIEMLLPNTEVRMRLKDQALLGIPALLGIFGLLGKLTIVLGALLGLGYWLKLHDQPPATTPQQWIAILAAGATVWFFIGRQVMRYRFRKMQFLKALADGLYFKNLDNHAGVIHRLADEAEEEEGKEALLAYAVLATAPDGLSAAELDQRIETWLRDGWRVEVDFEVEDGLAKLERLGLLERSADSRLRVAPLHEANRILDQRWDQLFTHANTTP